MISGPNITFGEFNFKIVNKYFFCPVLVVFVKLKKLQ